MKINILFFVFLLFVASNISFAQTDSLRIFWNVNPEPDMFEYQLYRAVNGATNFQLLQSVIHPDSLAVDRNQIQPGNLYAYTLRAVDSAGNQSEYSDTVAVGIPKIDWTLASLNNGVKTIVPLDDFLSDPDNQVSQLQLIPSQLNHLQIDISNGNLEITPVPLSYAGPASFDLKAIDPNGFWDRSTNIQLSVIQMIPTGINKINAEIPREYILEQNFPNPFNPVTHIKFGSPKTSRVKIEVFSLLGQKIKTLLDEEVSAGYYLVDFDATQLPSGIYLYRIEADSYQAIKRMILLK